MCVCVCVCVCVCSSIDADPGNQTFYLRIGGVGGWFLENTNRLKAEAEAFNLFKFFTKSSRTYRRSVLVFQF